MSLRKFPAAMRGLVLAGLFGAGAISSAHAGIVNGNYTVGFEINRGYAEVSSVSAPNVVVGALAAGNGPVDMFYEVATSSGAVVHSYTVNVTNVNAAAITGYHFEVGLTNLNWWLNADTDGDGNADTIDPDIDDDTVLNASDNARWVANISQIDTDGDQWGDVMDFAPSNANVPLNQVGGQAPFPLTPIFLAFNHSGLIDFVGGPTSSSFATFTQSGGSLDWSNGAIAPGATETFLFNLIVPDGLSNDGFILRQRADVVPEPGSIAAFLAMIAVAGRRPRNR
ncbi:MAG: hypothetical protein H7Z14_02990 [Anaerolineae bacterium]|nr:hypothetical protein [Phycisphaerae bacterium]